MNIVEVMLLLAWILAQVLVQPSSPSTASSVLVIEDFDHPNFHRSRLEAEWGSMDEHRLGLEFTNDVRCGPAGYALKVSFHDLRPEIPCGIWFSAAGRLEDDRLLLDVSPFEELQFRTRGAGPETQGIRLRVDLVGPRSGSGGVPATASFTVPIDGGPTWQVHRIPLDPRLWTLSGPESALLGSHLKAFRFLLPSSENAPSGSFYLDRIECVRKDRPSFDWKAASDDELMNYIEYHTYRFFERFADPSTGQAFDRSSREDVSSIAASGFALAGHAIAVSRGWISREEGALRVRRLLRSLTGAEDRIARNGIYYHFIDAATSLPKNGSEVSIIDTALLISGAYVSRNFFQGDKEIADLSGRLIRSVNWKWFFDASKGLFHMAWSPLPRTGYACFEPVGGGYFCGEENTPVYWGVYTDEVELISILAAASPTFSVPLTAFHSVDMTFRDYKGVRMANSYNGSLFTYLFGSCYLDTRSFGPSSSNFNWYLNSSQAITANHLFAAEHRLPSWAFGITACEGPDGKYHNYGAPPSTVAPDFDGTLAIYGLVGSVLHHREETLKAIRELFALNLFQECAGFADAWNPLRVDPKSTLPWVNWTGFGIDQGSILLILENARSGFAWKQFGSDAVIDRTLTALFPKREAH